MGMGCFFIEEKVTYLIEFLLENLLEKSLLKWYWIIFAKIDSVLIQRT